MAEDSELIQPKEGTTTPPTPNDSEDTPAPASGESSKSKVPKEVIQIPFLQAVLTGQPAAVSTPVDNKDPVLETIWKARSSLNQAGIGFYKSLAGDTGVIFNGLYVHPETISQADKAGKLLELAPPYTAVTEALLKDPTANPVLDESRQTPQGLAQAPAPAPTAGSVQSQAPPAPQTSQAPSRAPTGASAALLNRLQGARQGMMKPGGPTSGMRPGAGRVLNALMKPVV